MFIVDIVYHVMMLNCYKYLGFVGFNVSDFPSFSFKIKLVQSS